MKLTKVLLLAVLCTQVVMPVQAMDAQAQDGVLMGVAKDCVWAVSGIAKGLWKAGKYVWSYATPKRLEVLAAVGLGYAAYNRLFIINAIDAKYNPAADLPFKIATWKADASYGNHVDVRILSTQFLRDLQNFCHDNNITFETLPGSISTALQELDADLKVLQSYITYFRAMYYIPIFGREFSLMYDFENICVNRAGQTKCQFWTKTQFNDINADMLNRFGALLPYCTLHINYARAAKLWWKLKLLRMRLENIQGLVSEEIKRPSILTIQRDQRVSDLQNNSDQQHAMRIVPG